MPRGRDSRSTRPVTELGFLRPRRIRWAGRAKWTRGDLNPRPLLCESSDLPLIYVPAEAGENRTGLRIVAEGPPRALYGATPASDRSLSDGTPVREEPAGASELASSGGASGGDGGKRDPPADFPPARARLGRRTWASES